MAILTIATLAAVLLVVSRGHDPRTDPLKARSLSILPTVKLAPGSRFERSLGFKWAVSMDIEVPHGVQVSIDTGTGATIVGRSRHYEQVGLGPSTISMHSLGGRAAVQALIISDSRDGRALLLHRVSELHFRLRPGQFPLGADGRDRLHIDSRYGTSGFWPGALWQAASLVRGAGRDMFSRWALSATLTDLGMERSHTRGAALQSGESSLPALQALCQGRSAARRAALCGRLRRSVVAAADELVSLERSNAAAGTIPTDAGGRDAYTLVDSMMNIAILPWASRLTGRPVYRQVASRYAHAVARLLVRRDGSTIQVVQLDRASGRVLGKGTRQGISATSTWSRGQAWAVYGFAQSALLMHDRGLLRVALATARYVRRRLPAGGVPPWDYDAPRGAPVDVSAGAITAAGLFHLVAACHALPGVCGATKPWSALGKRMLAASLAHAAQRPPLGLLGGQILNEHRAGCWCNGGELMFGVTYALEALNLASRSR